MSNHKEHRLGSRNISCLLYRRNKTKLLEYGRKYREARRAEPPLTHDTSEERNI